MRGWGLREGVLVKMGFVYGLDRSELSDTFLSGGMRLGGSEGQGGIEGAKAARLERTCVPWARDSERAPLCFLGLLLLLHPRPPGPPHRHEVGALSATRRFRASGW